MPPFEYSVEAPPKNWAEYPKSFLVAAIPILNKFGNFASANHELTKIGAFKIYYAKGCPEILSFTPIKKSSKLVVYDYEVKGVSSIVYVITAVAYDKNSKYLASDNSTMLKGSGKLETDVDIAFVKLFVKPASVPEMYDSQKVVFKPKQDKLF